MSLPCHTTCALHAHESDKAIESEIEARETELLKEGGDCYPLAPDNIGEAFGMADTSFYDLLVGALKTQQHVFVHSLILNMTNEYWENQAAQKAKNDENEAKKQLREETENKNDD